MYGLLASNDVLRIVYISVLIAVVLIVGAVVLVRSLRRGGGSSSGFFKKIFSRDSEALKEKAAARIADGKNAVFSRKNYFLREDQADLLEIIKKLCGSKYVVLPNVALAAVAETQGGERLLNYCADFCVLSASFRVKFLVLIIDRHDMSAEQKEREDAVNRVSSAAGIPLVEIERSEINSPVTENILREAIN